MSEQTAELTQPITDISPFGDDAWKKSPTVPDPLTEEKIEPTLEVKDPVIADKDEEIKEENPESEKPNEPLKIPSATPPPVQDLPDDKKKLPESSIDIKSWLTEKEDEILNVLEQKRTLKNIDKLPHADVIKLKLKQENSDYTKEDIEDLFNERFAQPERPEEFATDDEEIKYKEQLAKWERKLEREAKSSKTELQKKIQELVLPDIPQTPIEPNLPTQEELDLQEKQREQNLQAIEGSLKELKSYNATYKDEEVEIPLAYSIAKEEKEGLKPLLDSLNSNLPQFFEQLNWIDKDGNLNTNKVVNDLHIIQNRDKVIQKFVNEAGNKKYADSVKRQKNIDFSGSQRRGNLSPSALEEAEKKVSGFLAAT